MRLNVLSDLHLSLGPLAIPANDADAVVLAGDIARPKEAIAWASGFAKPVLYVPGNHEFYGGSIAGTVAELKRLSAGSDIHVLDDDEVIIQGVRFLAARCGPISCCSAKARGARRRCAKRSASCAISAAFAWANRP
jgi:predicted phosphodiesterase